MTSPDVSKLPALPSMSVLSGDPLLNNHTTGYTADQMHAYALSALAASPTLRDPELQRQLEASAKRYDELPQWMRDNIEPARVPFPRVDDPNSGFTRGWNACIEAMTAPEQPAGVAYCPNCVTPWKCNGPHIGEAPTDGIDTTLSHDGMGTREVVESTAGAVVSICSAHQQRNPNCPRCNVTLHTDVQQASPSESLRQFNENMREDRMVEVPSVIDVQQGGDSKVEQTLRDALTYVGYRADGTLLELAERAELWMRESRSVIASQKSLMEKRERVRHTPSAQGGDVAALQAFKDYVHGRLDSAGVPKHPDGPHSAAGCRIGDRLDIALAGRGAQGGDVEQRARELLAAEWESRGWKSSAKEVRAGRFDHDPSFLTIVAALSQQPVQQEGEA